MLDLRITDRDGNGLTRINNYENLDVNVKLNDSRTASFSVNLYNPALAHVSPMNRMLKVYYKEALVYWGFIVRPDWQGKSTSVSVDTHDPTIFWKHRFHRFGHQAVLNAQGALDHGYPMDGRGFFILASSAVPEPHQLARGVRHPGILLDEDNYDFSDWTGDRPVDLSDPQEGDGLWMAAERGSGVFDTIQSLAEVSGAPDWIVVPDDTLEEGYFGRLEAHQKLGQDRLHLPFHYNWGADTLDDFQWAPDGAAMRNYAVTTASGGETDLTDDNHRALSHSEASWQEYGIMQEWDSGSDQEVAEVLKQRANAFVDAYAYPPDYFTISMKLDNPNSPSWPEDFDIGDRIKATAKRGYLDKTVTGRVTEVGLTQDSSTSTPRVKVTVVPDVNLDKGGGD